MNKDKLSLFQQPELDHVAQYEANQPYLGHAPKSLAQSLLIYINTVYIYIYICMHIMLLDGSDSGHELGRRSGRSVR